MTLIPKWWWCILVLCIGGMKWHWQMKQTEQKQSQLGLWWMSNLVSDRQSEQGKGHKLASKSLKRMKKAAREQITGLGLNLAVLAPFCVELACSLCVCVGFGLVLWFLPTIIDIYVRVSALVNASDTGKRGVFSTGTALWLRTAPIVCVYWRYEMTGNVND